MRSCSWQRCAPCEVSPEKGSEWPSSTKTLLVDRVLLNARLTAGLVLGVECLCRWSRPGR